MSQFRDMSETFHQSKTMTPEPLSADETWDYAEVSDEDIVEDEDFGLDSD